MKEYKQVNLYIVRAHNADTPYPYFDVSFKDGSPAGTVYESWSEGNYNLVTATPKPDMIPVSCFYMPDTEGVYHLAGFFFMEEE